MVKTRGILLLTGLSLLGLAVSGYLGFLHVALVRGSLFGGLLCGELGSIFNCHAVTASRFGQLFGLPLAFWGCLGYLATLSLSLIAWHIEERRESALTVVAVLSLLFLGVDAWLLNVMVRKIHFLCAFCLATDLVNLLLALGAQAALGRSWRGILLTFPSSAKAFFPGLKKPAAWAFWGVMFTGFIGAVSVEGTAQFFGRSSSAVLDRMRQNLLQAPLINVDIQGDPFLGNAKASIRMVEFSDFLCPLCQDAARFNAIILADHGDEVMLTVKNFPLDRTCNGTIPRDIHPGACRVAIAGECAQEQGKFWAFYDRVFRRGPGYRLSELEFDAQQAGLDMARFRECMASDRGRQNVERDIQEASRLGIMSTPTYVVNGVVVRGAIAPAAFEDLREALPRQQPSN